MDFITRHYEKLILLALSVISILAVWHMTQVMEKTKEVKDSDLEIRIPPPDYKPLEQLEKDYAQAKKDKEDLKPFEENADFTIFRTTGRFDAAKQIEDSKLKWQRAPARNKSWTHYSSDLVDIFKMAFCPHEKDKDDLAIPVHGIPYYCLTDSHQCVICGRELKSPPAKIKKRRMPTPDDIDGDGIPNSAELSAGLDPKDPNDALLDADGDGFSNRYEVVVGTDPRNPTSCPPLWRRLRFKEMAKIELPIRLTGLAGDSADPKEWEVAIKLGVRNRQGRLVMRDRYYKIDDMLEFDGSKYRVKNIERGTAKDAHGTAKEKYTVTLEEVLEDGEGTPRKLTMSYGEPTYSSDLRVVLEDIGVPADPVDGKRYWARGRNGREEAVFKLRRGELFEVQGTSNVGSARNVVPASYRLMNFDEIGKTATLAVGRVQEGENATLDPEQVPMIVTEFGFIEEEDWVIAPTDRPDEKKNTGKDQRGRRNRRRPEQNN